MLRRALRIGTAFFSALLGVAAIVLASEYWHHQSVANRAQPSATPEVHTDVIFVVFAFSSLALVAGVVATWLVCIAAGDFWLARRR